jgi:hypothetical protein
MAMSRAGVAKLQSFGVVFGYQGVVIYVEPRNGSENSVVSNTARTALIMNGEPLPWNEWASEFREQMPTEIQDLMRVRFRVQRPHADNLGPHQADE